MGFVYKSAVSYAQQQSKIQSEEIDAAFKEVKQSIREETNNRITADLNLQQELSAIRGVVTEEISARTESETLIKSDILTEKNQRENDVANLQNAINTEKTARENTESSLRDEFEAALDAEKVERSQEISDMQTAISVAMGNAQRLQEIENENLRRQMEADAASQGTTLSQLNERLTTEEQTRAAEDTKLTNAIATEKSNRQTAITNLQSTLTTSINNEKNLREAADTNLQTGFNSALATETQNRTNALNSLETSLKSYVDSEIAGVEENLNDYVTWDKSTELKILTNKGWRAPDDATLTISTVPSQVGSLTYNGNAQSPTWINFDNAKLEISGDTSKIDAGEYTVTFKPLDLYVWADTLDQQTKTATWKIEPLKLAKPAAAVTTFTFNNSAQSLNVSNFDSNYISQNGNVSATNVNSYSAVYKLKNTTNTKWSDNSTADVTINWKINVLKLEKPSAAVTEFQHDGNTKTLSISNFNSTYENQTGTISAANVGTYSVIFSLKSTTNTTWNDNSTSNVTINWEIKQSVLSEEQSGGFAQIGTLTYNGNSQTVSIQNYDPNLHELSSTTSAVNAGTYTAKISPKSGCTWSDGTTTAKSISWTIKPMTLQKPVAASTTFDYDGTTKTLSVSNYNSSRMTQSGVTSASEAGEYSVTYTLNSTTNYIWADNSTAAVVIEWTIGAMSIPKPTAATTSFTYSGAAKTLSVQNYNANYMSMSGTISETNAGSYSVTYSLTNTARAKWADGSTADVKISWKIERKALTATQSTFSQNGTLTFNGAKQTVSITNYNSSYHTLSGTTYSTAAGTFTAKVAPNSNYCWNDSTTAAKSVTWTIEQKILEKPTVADTNFIWSGNTYTLAVSNYESTFLNQTGTVSAKNVGEYSVTYSIKAPASAHWTDGTTDNVVFNWQIEGQKLSQTYSTFSQDGTLTYTGARLTVSIKNYDSSYHTLGGTTYATNTGVYTATITPKDGYCFNDGSSTAKEISWSILPMTLDIPTAAETDFTYDGNTKTLSISNYNSTWMTRSGTYSAKAAGNYQVTFTLKNTTNTQWANGSTDSIVIDWSIGLTKVTIPSLATSTFTYDGNSKEPVFNDFDSSLMTASSETSAVNAGNYVIKVALKDKTRYCWADNSTDDKTFAWIVKRKNLTAAQSTFSQSGTLNYTGSSQTVTISNYDANYHSLGGVYLSVNAGTFIAKISPLPNYAWSDSTFAEKSVTWTINPIKLAKPAASVTDFTYDKQAHALTISNFNSTYITESGTTSATAAGSYSVKYTLKNTTNTIWADSSTSSVIIAWTITKTRLTKPTLQADTFTYSGSNRTVTIKNFNSTYMTQEGVAQAKDAGNYSITISLIDDTVVEWEDGTTADVVLNWVINKAAMTATYSAPSQKTVPTFTNKSISLLSTTYLNGYSSTYQNWSSDTSAVNAGTYTAKVTPKDNYTWNDGTVSTKTVTWKIDAAQIDPPTVSADLTYNENVQSPTLTGYDSSKMTLGGTTSATNAGDYTLTVSPASSNYIFSTGESSVNLIWTIKKITLAKPTLTNARDVFVRTGATRTTANIKNYDEELMTATGDFSGFHVGDYYINVKLKDAANYCFEDVAGDTVSLKWYIAVTNVTAIPYDGKNEKDYTGNEQSFTWSTAPNAGYFDSAGDISATTIGNYSFSITLKYPGDTYWRVRTSYAQTSGLNYTLESTNSNFAHIYSDTLTFNWSIGVTQITAPSISTDYFDYDGTAKTVTINNFDSSTMTKSGTESATNKNFYTVTFSLKDKNNTCWSTGGSEDIVIEWAIGKKKVAKPTISGDTEFTYSGSAKTLSVEGYDADAMTQGGYLSATDAGSYTVTYTLKSTTACQYVWSDNSTAAVSFTWKINKAALSNVTFSQSGSLTYDGTAKTVTIKNFNASTMDVSSTTSATAAGTYTAKVTPKSNYTWSDGTSTAKSVSWKINPKTLTKPSASTINFEYDGTAKTLTVSNYNSTYMNQTGTVSATDSGEYSVSYSLKSTTNTIWNDNSTAAVVINWSIGGSYIAVPTISPTTQISQGLTKIHSVTISGFDSDTMTVGVAGGAQFVSSNNTVLSVPSSHTGNYNSGEPRTLTVTFALKDKTNTAWAGGGTANKSLTWSITKKTLSAAESTFTQDKTVSYDGNSHSVTEAVSSIKAAYIGEYYTLSSDTGTNGTITTTITPTAAAQWSDGTSAAKTVQWQIENAAATLTLSSDTVTINWTSAPSSNGVTINFTTNSSGTISLSSSDSYVAAPQTTSTTAASGKFGILIKGNGTATITVSQAASGGYSAVTKYITVKVTTKYIHLSWSEIQSLSSSGNLLNYMRIGDLCNATVSGTVGTLSINKKVYFRLIGYNHNTSVEGANRAHFMSTEIFTDSDYGKTIANGAATNSFVYSTATSSGNNKDYSQSSLRTRGTEFYNALPSSLQNVIVACMKKMATGSYGNDKIWIPSMYEIFGTGDSVYIQQYEYFENGNSASMNKIYWLRDFSGDTMSNKTYYVAANGSSGFLSNDAQGISYGFVPCFTVG